ncbi:FecR domain-containing protein [Gemmatimonas sp.]|uniref:FecR family protein n=1 Tax=Gemmatimonas sp. TaxID=1962908 RepID=UPI0025BA1CBB|nr:FecR domain-containing protein [Gemmatimonas sp.]MCA2983530.1 FecR domain-containing protein [Gemmatimonas sp.]MCA2995829.1 FecR domain-containing protein [Gemmatimonas sp.]
MSDRAPIAPDDPYDLRHALIERQRRDLESLLAAADDVEPPFDAARAWTQLAPRLVPRRTRDRIGRRLLLVAVGLVAATLLVMVRRPTSGGVAAPTVRTTAAGVVDSVTLADGTVVILDGQSRIETAAAFGQEAREVRLRGRAHFRVAADSTRPFRVIASGMVAEALGTAFTVADDASGDVVEVVVTHGRVAFGAPGASSAPVVLHAGERARSWAGRIATERGLGLTEVPNWTTGARRLSGVPLREVLPQLVRWFGVTVLTTDSALAQRRVSADWRHAATAEALAELALLLDATAIQRGDTVILRPRGVERPRVR